MERYMALSKELQLQQGYQSPIQAQAYNPLQVADASQQMEQNRATALENARREDAVLLRLMRMLLSLLKR